VSARIRWESLRPWPAYLAATMLPLSLAATNLFKVLMVLFALAALGIAFTTRTPIPGFSRLRTPIVVALMLAAMTLSLLYTSAPMHEALHDLNKYSKLLLIPLVLVLLRSRREALFALSLYIGAETFVILTSYLLSAGWEVPWVIKPLGIRQSVGTVYSSYLDQSMMTAAFAALVWNLRRDFPGRHGPRIAIGLVLLAAVNVLLLLPGRSAQVALLCALALALFWETPPRARPAAVLMPLVLLAAVMGLSPHFRGRVTMVATEALGYMHGNRAPTSTGTRLNLWQRSAEAIEEKPLSGHGVGSWPRVYGQLERSESNPMFANVRNPHQEYLLWGEQLGLGGIALLLAFEALLLRDALPFRPDVRHATWSMVAVFAIVCLFNSALFDALIGDYFCLLLGVLLVLGIHTPDQGAAA
jgi:O-antigen ligase